LLQATNKPNISHASLSIALLKGHDRAVNDLSWSPNGQNIATTTSDENGMLKDAWFVAIIGEPPHRILLSPE
jgi:WD40 repeat protein